MDILYKPLAEFQEELLPQDVPLRTIYNIYDEHEQNRESMYMYSLWFIKVVLCTVDMAKIWLLLLPIKYNTAIYFKRLPFVMMKDK